MVFVLARPLRRRIPRLLAAVALLVAIILVVLIVITGVIPANFGVVPNNLTWEGGARWGQHQLNSRTSPRPQENVQTRFQGNPTSPAPLEIVNFIVKSGFKGNGSPLRKSQIFLGHPNFKRNPRFLRKPNIY